MEFVPCDARVLADTITKDNNIFDENRVTRKNGLCSQLNAAEK